MEKLLKPDLPVAERFYAPYREQFNPDLTVADAQAEEARRWSSRVKDHTPKVTSACLVKFGTVSPVSHADHPTDVTSTLLSSNEL